MHMKSSEVSLVTSAYSTAPHDFPHNATFIFTLVFTYVLHPFSIEGTLCEKIIASACAASCC